MRTIHLAVLAAAGLALSGVSFANGVPPAAQVAKPGAAVTAAQAKPAANEKAVVRHRHHLKRHNAGAAKAPAKKADGV